MTAIKTENLTKVYGEVTALDHLDLEVPDHVVFGFLGPNGAGKTTTVKLLTGFSRPTSGYAYVAGEKVESHNLTLQSKIGLLPDVPAFYDWMSGREFMHLIGELHHLPAKEIGQRTEELLEMVELKKAAKRRIGGYSRGMRQRLGIAQALINHPSVLFMDEPTSALDPIGRREVLDLILRLKENATIFMSTHNLAEVEKVCDMVGIINKGKLIITSTVTDLQQKHARSIFEMEFLENAVPFIEKLKTIPWLTAPEINLDHGHQIVRVQAVDMALARRELPRLISDSGLTLTRYELSLPNLEEIFVELINGRSAK